MRYDLTVHDGLDDPSPLTIKGVTGELLRERTVAYPGAPSYFVLSIERELAEMWAIMQAAAFYGVHPRNAIVTFHCLSLVLYRAPSPEPHRT